MIRLIRNLYLYWTQKRDGNENCDDGLTELERVEKEYESFFPKEEVRESKIVKGCRVSLVNDNGNYALISCPIARDIYANMEIFNWLREGQKVNCVIERCGQDGNWVATRLWRPDEDAGFWNEEENKDGYYEQAFGQDLGVSKITREQFVRQNQVPETFIDDDDVDESYKSRNIVFGEPFKQRNKHCRKEKLFDRKPPRQLQVALRKREDITFIYPSLSQDLTLNNYKDRFQALLFMEESEEQENMKFYDQVGVILERKNEYFTIEVPGLAEGRPSLLIGDRVRACFYRGVDQEGYIHEMSQNEVFVKFHPSFHTSYNNEVCNRIKFFQSRLPIRRCHQAVLDSRTFLPEVLFPSSKPLFKNDYVPKNPIELRWCNPELNDRQKVAVFNILRARCRPTPFIIFGPPGTGKTITLVEAILQVFLYKSKREKLRILACSPSNSAADLIATKLLESNMIEPDEFVRVFAHHKKDHVNDRLIEVAQFCEDDACDWVMRKYKLIVTTCCQAGAISKGVFSDVNFTHIFIDEAGQCTEPETLVPIELGAKRERKNLVIVLAGDHRQLGPVCASHQAAKYGLALSYMERMTTFKQYERSDEFPLTSGYDPDYIVKLVMNYRSSHEIMKVSSELFYDGDLEFDSPMDKSLVQQFFEQLTKDGIDTRLSKKPFPIMFHGVIGQDRRDTESPSFYNSDEVAICWKYIKSLYSIGLTADDIGIITPYRKQASSLRSQLNLVKLPLCKIATIEEFQGSERKVIIISTVRSTQCEFEEHDLKYNLGFVSNPKRFNVAVSRAMSLLIIVGNPFLLSTFDKCWLELIRYCIENDAYVGCPFNESQ